MSKCHREHRPLLCDEHSDEEDDTSPKFQRRIRYFSSSRAKTQAKGAASILSRWPDHLSSILTYWWMGLGMIAVLIFVIYNSIVAIAILPPTHMRPAKILSLEHNSLNVSREITNLPNIFMHVFVTSNDNLNINEHLSYIESFSKKYYGFQKNFVIVVNDVTDDIISISDEKRNEMALNSLWSDTKDIERQTFGKNITFKIISLTKYMDESPIKKYWRRLPNHFIEFLIRCIAIWDKGGISFNPEILSSNSFSPVYIDKIHTFLNKYVKSNHATTQYVKKNTRKKKKVNNIRDIIDNLENDDKYNSNQYNLSEAENKEIIATSSYDKEMRRDNKSDLLKNHKEKYTLKKNNEIDSLKNVNKSDLLIIPKIHKNMSLSKRKILPMYLKFLFRDPSINLKANTSRNEKKILDKHGAKASVKSKRNINHKRTTKSLSATNKENNSLNATDSKTDNSKLTIDLKGNLVATDTPCHAFIGTIFSNAIHHSEEESLTDFIIKELSMFCKGFISSCKGVDVILL